MTSYNNHYLQKQIVSGKKHTLHSSSQISILPQSSGKTPSGHSNLQSFAQASKQQNEGQHAGIPQFSAAGMNSAERKQSVDNSPTAHMENSSKKLERPT